MSSTPSPSVSRSGAADRQSGSAPKPPRGRVDRTCLPSAVVMIDMQNDVIHNRDARIARLIAASAVVERCVEMVEAARGLGVPIVYVTIVRRAPHRAAVDSSAADGKDAAGASARPLTCVEGSSGAEVVRELQPTDRDFIVVKRSRGAFIGTELDTLLRSLSVERILLCGVATNLGVESTARSAFDLCYKVAFMSDCCCGFDQGDHEWALARIFPKMGSVQTWRSALADCVSTRDA